MPWELFEAEAAGYEAWYAKGRGARVEEAERALLGWMGSAFPATRSVLEVGCGTGHFARWLVSRVPRVVGIDRSPAMLAETGRQRPSLAAVLGDAHQLPFRGQSLDLVVFITALEFLDRPGEALAEAVRVARQGLLLIVLNRWSIGGGSRRWGAQARKPILGQAHDYALPDLRRVVRRAAGPRLERLLWRSAVFPGRLWTLQTRVPIGDVLGIAVVLKE